MQLVIAAITTRPWSSSNSVPSSSVTSIASLAAALGAVAAGAPLTAGRGLPRSSSWSSAGGSEAGKDSSIASSRPLPSCSPASGSNSPIASRKASFASASGTRSCGRFGPAMLGTTSPRSSSSRSEKAGSGSRLVVEHPLLAGVGVDQLDRLGRAAGELQVAQRLGVDREDRAGRAELRRHVAERRPVGQAEGRQARPEELDELGDDAALAQHLGDGQHEVGRGRALRQLAGELEADHLRQQHRDRLAEHRRLGLDPADAPAEHAEAVDHRRVRVGADQGVGVGLQGAVALAAVDDLGEVLEVDLVADPGRRRHDAEVVEGLAGPT